MNESRMLSCDQIRRVDQVAINQWGIPGVVLMENAGRGVADVMCDLGISGPVLVACAKGNNGGDGLVIARHLHLRGYEVQVLLSCQPTELAGDAAWNYDLLSRTSVRVHELASLSPIHLLHELERSEWAVDALLGTGAQGAPREPVAGLIEAMNQCDLTRLAVDIPSGLDARSGVPARVTFRADHTCTFVAEKDGFAALEAKPFLGHIHTLDIGLPWELVVQASELPQ